MNVSVAFNLAFEIHRVKALLGQGRIDALDVVTQGREIAPADRAALHYEVAMTYDTLAQKKKGAMDAGATQKDRDNLEGLRTGAFDHFAAAAEHVPSRYIYAYRAAATARRLGKLPEAEAYLARALAIEPQNQYARLERAKLHLACGRKAMAIVDLRAVHAERPWDGRIVKDLAELGERVPPRRSRGWAPNRR